MPCDCVLPSASADAAPLWLRCFLCGLAEDDCFENLRQEHCTRPSSVNCSIRCLRAKHGLFDPLKPDTGNRVFTRKEVIRTKRKRVKNGLCRISFVAAGL